MFMFHDEVYGISAFSLSQDIGVFPNEAKAYMDANFTSGGCLGEAVARSGLSSRRFNDLFKGLVGTTPNRYLVLRRIEQAKALLELQSMTMSEIAEQCGFSDVYYFSKVFKQTCGVSPGKWNG